MKIESNMKNTYLKHYNIAKGIAVNKKQVLKNKTIKVPTYLISALITIVLLTIFLVIFCLIDKSKIITILYLTMLIVYIFYVIIRTTWSYNFKKKKNFLNEIILDEEGLTDQSFYGIKITLNWSKLKAIVIKKQTITILTDTNLYFFFDINEKEEILKAINRYNKDLTIIGDV